MDGFRILIGKPMEERTSIEDLKTLVEFVLVILLFLSLFLSSCFCSPPSSSSSSSCYSSSSSSSSSSCYSSSSSSSSSSSFTDPTVWRWISGCLMSTTLCLMPKPRQCLNCPPTSTLSHLYSCGMLLLLLLLLLVSLILHDKTLFIPLISIRLSTIAPK